ncbi:AbrB/MazE/SpoVT family DNA-binding domain-containing protein [Conexibacter sp. CPCC 206217]|uniref:AbrB/MazE/SpoVT family DNA-binding domain-containing protein n=1 Tax=Conexibacter sp. CPCC 206217 TaxID=3064574 RepID=UPI00271F718E|nr:AbrB/MazE/SpoVT family DNA-binding domain-containing protein [Conexibacter sp. CPCC 206217]MDO8210395.1 AbrB/MazE/SpoVT family DNA-binding domain-containing protein [Conexibacter sp. CPCC 206217]
MAHAERHVTVGDRGRLVLPAAVRSQLGLEPGTRMLLTTEPDGSLRLRPYRAVADRHRGILGAANGPSLVDELIAERRREAAREDAE